MQNVCTIIEKGKESIPPAPQSNNTIPFNKNSTRAHSKKHRVYVFRDFLHDNFQSIMTRYTDSTSLILDVAGGRGDLSWILYNIDGIDSIIADPRIPSHRSLVKSVNFLLNHPGEL